MKSKNFSVSIGIPAYNEEKMIKLLLAALLSQKEEGFVLNQIIVMCDGCTDNTARVAREIRDSRIRVIDDGKRCGKSARVSKIFQVFKADILFLIDADVIIKDDFLLSRIVSNTDFGKAGIVGINAMPLPAKTTFEKIIEAGVLIRKEISRNWRGGNNYLSFMGCFLGLDGKYAKSIQLPHGIVNNDGYLYLKAKELGYETKYIDDLNVYYKSPANFKDHLAQSSRYQKSHEELQNYFSIPLFEEYAIPFPVSFRSTFLFFLRRPLDTLLYIGVRFLTKIRRDKKVTSRWRIAFSTKNS